MTLVSCHGNHLRLCTCLELKKTKHSNSVDWEGDSRWGQMHLQEAAL